MAFSSQPFVTLQSDQKNRRPRNSISRTIVPTWASTRLTYGVHQPLSAVAKNVGQHIAELVPGKANVELLLSDMVAYSWGIGSVGNGDGM